MFIGAGQVGPWAKADGVTPFDQVSCDDTNSRSRHPYPENQQAHRLLIIRLSPRCRARQQGGRRMDSRTCWITDDRDLFSPSGCNEAVVPGWIYASDSWRRGVILCTRISPLADACTDTVCTPNPWASRSVIEYQFVSSFVRFDVALRTLKKTYNKQASIRIVTAMTL
jgi:hypothetical protein